MRWLSVALLLMVVCAACGGTSREAERRVRAPLMDGQVGGVRLVHVNVLAPPKVEQQAGDDLGLYLTLVNASDREQVLDGVSTVHAERVVYRPSTGAARNTFEVKVPPKGTVSLQYGKGRPHFELQDIHRPLGGTPIDVTFRFPTAGTLTLRVPVFDPSRGNPTLDPSRGTPSP